MNHLRIYIIIIIRVEIEITEPKIKNAEYTYYSIGLNGPVSQFDPPRIFNL